MNFTARRSIHAAVGDVCADGIINYSYEHALRRSWITGVSFTLFVSILPFDSLADNLRIWDVVCTGLSAPV
jgi:hypothetical protein